MNDNFTYLISYDMVGDGNYDTLINHIKSYGTWAHITESTWAIVSQKTATEIRDEVKKYLSNGSRLIVIKSANVAAWSNALCTNEWLKEHI